MPNLLNDSQDDDSESSSSSSSSKSSSTPKKFLSTKDHKLKNFTEVEIDSSDKIVINKRFASLYEEKQRKKELVRAKEVLEVGSDDEEYDSESDESEDEEAKLLSSGLDAKIMKTINMLKKKDPKVYDPNTVWFSDAGSDEEEEEDDEAENDQSSKKKKRFKDVLREQLTSSTNQAEEDEEDTEDNGNSRLRPELNKRQLMYDAEQRKLREQFLDNRDQDEDDEGSDEKEDLFQVKNKSKQEMEQEELELQKEIEELERLEGNKEDEKRDDGFLLNYIKKKMWKESVAIKEDNSDEDEETFEASELFESKYNFRFEQLAAEEDKREDRDALNQVTGHSRQIAGSLRRVDDKRKSQREERKERKEKEKRAKEEELKRLKNLKKQELKSRLSKISEIGGLKKLGIIDESILEEDWDPEKHQQLMSAQFDEDYYQQEEEDYQQFQEYDNEALVEDPTYDPVNAELIYAGGEEEEEEDQDYDEENEEQEETETGRSLSGHKEVSESTQKEVKSMMDELYQLDYEDLVAGMPCRFKYRSVEAEDFGLSTEEILLADDKDLNRFVSLKYLAPFNRKRKDESELQRKRKKLQKSLSESVREMEEQEQQLEEQRQSKRSKQHHIEPEETDLTQSKKRRRKRKQRSADEDDQEGDSNEIDNEEGEIPSSSSKLPTNVVSPVKQGKAGEKTQDHAHAKQKQDVKQKTHRRKHKNMKTKASLDNDPAKKRMSLYK